METNSEKFLFLTYTTPTGRVGRMTVKTSGLNAVIFALTKKGYTNFRTMQR